MKEVEDVIIKVIIIGNTAVGKTSLLNRFASNEYSEKFVTTIGIDFRAKVLQRNGRKIKLQIWDTAGQERYAEISRAYYRGAQAVAVVFDVTDLSSFQQVENWFVKVQQNSGDDQKFILLGNKCDRECRVVTQKQGLEMANKLSCSYIEVSAKTGENVEDAFLKMVDVVMADMIAPEGSVSKENNSLFTFDYGSGFKTNTDSSCC